MGDKMSKNIQLHIEGMTCTSCAAAVEKALGKVPQVEVAQVNFAGKKALLQVNDVDQDALVKAVRDAGYSVVNPAEKRAQADEHVRKERQRLVWSWIVTTPLMVLMFLKMVWQIDLLPGTVGEVTRLALAGFVIYGIGFPVIRSTIQSFRNLTFTMDSLIGIGSTAAFSTGILRLAGVEIGDFTSVGAMIIAINYIGTYIKVKATGSASSAIQQLLELGAKQATRVTEDGTTEVVDVTELSVGDRVRVRPGEKIPADGTIVRGTTSIDESIVSGESIPVDKGENDDVIGATINQMGTIEVRVAKTGSESFLSQIVELVEEAQSSRVPVQELADRVTAYFVPAILVLSILTFGGWMFATGGTGVTQALSAAIATLVIACPCALGLATPTALMVGMGYGAEHGVLIRNGEAIQTARSLDTIVFDKTGTLTIGRPEVRDTIGTNGIAPTPGALAVTSAVEGESEHPLARALTDYTTTIRETDAAIVSVHNTRAIPGHGITAQFLDGPGGRTPNESSGSSPFSNTTTYPANTVRVGSVRWLRGEGARFDGTQEAKVEEWKARGMTVVGTSIENEVVALFAIADALKKDAKAAIAAIHALGLKTAMLTGDSQTAAQSIADEAGIDDVFAELLPENKIESITALQREGRKVAMVGDGINDAPALKQSNVGIAIGTGTDIAIESADITLMSSSLQMIPQAVELSQRTFGKIRTNLFWAFFYNLVAIPLAIAGVLHPVVAEVAMAFSSITVVSNSLHLRRILRRRVGVTETKTEGDTDMGLFGSKQKVTYHIADMNCEHCEAKVTAALTELPEIKRVKATAKNKEVVIEYDGSSAPDLATVNAVLEPAGYPATE